MDHVQIQGPCREGALVEVVAGLSLKNLKPRVWCPKSGCHLADVRAVMLSYAEFHLMPARRKAAMDLGLRGYLGIAFPIRIYVDNGAFYFLRKTGRWPREAYEEFVREARPDWYPIPEEYIPTPAMSRDKQRRCYERTMSVNRAFEHDGFVPVMHVSRHLPEYIADFQQSAALSQKPNICLGGIVPNLLRAPKAVPYGTVLARLHDARTAFPAKHLHVFGMGGTATVHLAALLGFDSIDSSGWRNRAARGIVQLPGSGDRMIAKMGNWRGREPSRQELAILRRCECPACKRHGLRGLRRDGIEGFCNRATHNLYVLIAEAKWVEERLQRGTYARTYKRRLDNTIYAPLIEQVVQFRESGWG